MINRQIDENLPVSYRNKIFNRDVLDVLSELPDNSIDMIYGDPDYNVGINYSGRKYTQKWNDYIEWYIELTHQSMRVLKDTGNLFMMNYPKQNSHMRVKYLDEHAYDVFEYVWVYNTNVGHSPRRFTTAHRTILHATKSKNNKWYKNQVAEPYQNPNDKRIQKRIAEGHVGRMPYSWWYHDLVKNVSKEKTIHACQIPIPLVERLVKTSTTEGDDVFVLFGGSGNELVALKDMKRNFISCELRTDYFDFITQRLHLA